MIIAKLKTTEIRTETNSGVCQSTATLYIRIIALVTLVNTNFFAKYVLLLLEHIGGVEFENIICCIKLLLVFEIIALFRFAQTKF